MRTVVGSLLTGIALVIMFIGSCFETASWYIANAGLWLQDD